MTIKQGGNQQLGRQRDRQRPPPTHLLRSNTDTQTLNMTNQYDTEIALSAGSVQRPTIWDISSADASSARSTFTTQGRDTHADGYQNSRLTVTRKSDGGITFDGGKYLTGNTIRDLVTDLDARGKQH